MHSCKDCPDRHLYCHDDCERYRKDCEERAMMREKRYKENMYNNYIMRQARVTDKIKRKYREKG